MGSFFNNEPEDEWESDEWLNPSSRPEPKTRFDRAMAYFGDEHIRCKSDVDKKTVEQLYRVLKENNIEAEEQDSLAKAVGALDANLFNLCKAIICQNFMLMRKVDDLSARIARLENSGQRENKA